jgi:GlpG protein
MRKLRDLATENEAAFLSDALAANGIEANVIESQQGDFAVWVVDEEKLKDAQSLAANWLDQGDAQGLDQAARRGRSTRELSARIEERKEQKRQLIAERMTRLARPRPVVLTWALIAACALVAWFTQLGDERATVAALLIVDPRQPVSQIELPLFGMQLSLLSLQWHEPWRLVTPMLLHFGAVHILFNMLWLADLGRTIETRHGALYLALFALSSAAISNLAQYEIAKNPIFGGMSGVVYGLLGLVWARGKFDPHASYGLSRGTAQFMLIWLLLGFIGELAQGMGLARTPGMANWCHLFGLLVGVAWGYLAARRAH